MSKKRYVIVVALVVFVLATMGLSGCKKVVENAVEGAIEDATGVDVDTDEGSVTYETEDGATVEISGEQAEIPEGFPDDLPVYKADVESASKISSEYETGFYVGLVTEDPYDEVYEWYKEKLVDEGWELLGEMSVGEAGARSGVITIANDTSEGGVTFAEDGDVTRIAISINVK